jgi:hypothetical protein
MPSAGSVHRGGVLVRCAGPYTFRVCSFEFAPRVFGQKLLSRPGDLLPIAERHGKICEVALRAGTKVAFLQSLCSPNGIADEAH